QDDARSLALCGSCCGASIWCSCTGWSNPVAHRARIPDIATNSARTWNRRALPTKHAQMQACTVMAPAAEAPIDQREKMDRVAQEYYDSDDIFNYYQQVWGEEYIHVGLYTKFQGEDKKLKGVQRIAKASSISTQELLSLCFPAGDGSLAPEKCVLVDMGAGFGGTARVAAKEYGCDVICINISKRQNDLNISLNKAAGLEGKISVPGEKSFFDTGLPDSSCDVVCSQDAFSHAGPERYKALAEASRLLKSGGRLVFTDFMQTEEADDKDLEVVCKPHGMDNMATLSSYQQCGKDHGLEVVEFADLIENFGMHYTALMEVLEAEGKNLKGVRQEFVAKTLAGLTAWKTASDRGLMSWGIIVLQKPVGSKL
ncbi:unnamed protein product, partial [Laminaria digitata]